MGMFYRGCVSSSARDTVHWIEQGTAVSVNGTQRIEMRHGHIVPADGWRESRSLALADVANGLEEIAAALRDRAQTIRQQAAAVDGTEAITD